MRVSQKWDSGARAVAVMDEHGESIRTIPAMAHNCASPINLKSMGQNDRGLPYQTAREQMTAAQNRAISIWKFGKIITHANETGWPTF
jgi:hypothetical protein